MRPRTTHESHHPSPQRQAPKHSLSTLLWIGVGLVAMLSTACIKPAQVRTKPAPTARSLPLQAQSAKTKRTQKPQAQANTNAASADDKHARHLEVPAHQLPGAAHLFGVSPAYKRPAAPPADAATPAKKSTIATTQVPPSRRTSKAHKRKRRLSKRRRRLARRRKQRRRRLAKRRKRRSKRRKRARRRKKSRRRRWQRRFAAKRIVRWHKLLSSLKGASHYFSAKDAKRVYRSVRWKFRRAKRKYHSIPEALKRDIRDFLASMLQLRRHRLANGKGKNYRPYRNLIKQQKRPATLIRKDYGSACRFDLKRRTKRNCSRITPKKKRRHYARRIHPRSMFYWPTSSRYVGSKYGWRKGPFSGRRGFHSGLDIGAEFGDPVFAAASGRVIKTGWYGGCGLTIFIRHRNGLRTGYCHLATIYAKRGKWVRGGQLIGRTGSTGSATAAHLHFTVRRGRRYIDPYPILRGRRYRRRLRKRRRRRKYRRRKRRRKYRRKYRRKRKRRRRTRRKKSRPFAS